MTRERVLWVGLGLLALSLLLNLAISYQAPDQAFDDLALLQTVGWFGSAALYTGAGLTVAGVVLRALAADHDDP